MGARPKGRTEPTDLHIAYSDLKVQQKNGASGVHSSLTRCIGEISSMLGNGCFGIFIVANEIHANIPQEKGMPMRGSYGYNHVHESILNMDMVFCGDFEFIGFPFGKFGVIGISEPDILAI